MMAKIDLRAHLVLLALTVVMLVRALTVVMLVSALAIGRAR
jgi:hypothetical protein